MRVFFKEMRYFWKIHPDCRWLMVSLFPLALLCCVLINLWEKSTNIGERIIAVIRKGGKLDEL